MNISHSDLLITHSNLWNGIFRTLGILTGSLLFFQFVDAQLLQQGSKLTGTFSVGGSEQGHSVAISADGNTAIVGGRMDNAGVGATWVFTRSNGVWSQQGEKLIASDAGGTAFQGWWVSLSADGNTALVGGPTDNGGFGGAAYVFIRSGGVWSQQGNKLVPNEGNGGYFGHSCAISGDGNTALIGGVIANSGTGAAWVFTRTNGMWTQQGTMLIGSAVTPNAFFGWSSALSYDGNTAAIGAWMDNSGIGAVWVFTRSSGVWSQQGNKFLPSGTAGNTNFGTSVSLSADGNTLLIGGMGDNSGYGAAWIYTRSGNNWSDEGGKLVGTNGIGAVGFGISVSLSADGKSALIGGHRDNNYIGAAWLFAYSNGIWNQIGSKLVGTGVAGSNCQQGFSLALSGDALTAISGGHQDESDDRGAAWIFANPSPTIKSIQDIPNDQGGKVRVTWERSFCDATGKAAIVSYHIWRKVPPGMPKHVQNKHSMKIMNDTLGTLYDYLSSIPAVQSLKYNVVVPTLSDSSGSNNSIYSYLVSAHTSTIDEFYLSTPYNGYSIDNLAPSPPNYFTVAAIMNGNIKLSWQSNNIDRDLDEYWIYRGETSGFPLTRAHRLAHTNDTTFMDITTIPGHQYHYRVTACDIHGNQSTPSAEIATVSLAAELTSFCASFINGKDILLQWRTATESNNHGFEIERREVQRQHTVNGHWVHIGFVQGAGNSNSPKEYSYIDHGIPSGQYEYRLKQIDFNGSFTYSPVVEVDIQILPTQFVLSQNYPNPFNPITTIRYALPCAAHVKLTIHDILGREVAMLVNEEQNAGWKEIEWNAAGVSSGIYYYRAQARQINNISAIKNDGVLAGNIAETKKLLLHK